ncbi:Uncharacterized protein Adt_03900 [Abeliophyllum distichum]|uniref:Uncharacterized protein n=1 Tax=Abeliophyllum distichum TaxID=126358 RepID=A0ABD1VZT1_9LAMI
MVHFSLNQENRARRKPTPPKQPRRRKPTPPRKPPQRKPTPPRKPPPSPSVCTTERRSSDLCSVAQIIGSVICATERRSSRSARPRADHRICARSRRSSNLRN